MQKIDFNSILVSIACCLTIGSPCKQDLPMLIQFRAANFRSIRETQVLSLVKGTGDELENTHTFTVSANSQGGTLAMLHSAAIYGANASGKSNVLLALYAMKQVVINSHKLQKGDELKPISAFRLNAECRQAPSQFEVVFMAGGVRYQYGFAATSTQVHQEWLLAFPKGRPQEWFSREWNAQTQTYTWKLSDHLKGARDLWKKSTRQNALFLSTAVQLNAEVLLPIFDWFKRNLGTILSVDGPGKGYTASLCEQEAQKQKILALLKAADIAVHDMQVESKPLLERVSEIQKSALSQEEREQLKDALVRKVSFVRLDNHNTPQQFDLVLDESDGTQKLFALLGPWLDVLEDGAAVSYTHLTLPTTYC
jgi:hypothetical protein